MLAGSVFIEPCAVRRKMNHQMKPGDSVERRESLRDLLLGVFAGSLERSDVAIAEARPGRGIRLQHAAMKIHEAEAPAEFANVVVGLVISGQHPEPLAERLEHFAAAVEPFTKRGEIARGDVDVGRLLDDPRKRAEIAVNIAEDQDLHWVFFAGGAVGGCCGTIRLMLLCSMPFVSQPSSRTLPASSKTTRYVNG